MPSFRSARSQAEYAVSQKSATGQSRHENKDDGKLHSIGSQRTHTERLTLVASWLASQPGNIRLRDLTPELACNYLADRASHVSQKTLDLDRQAIQTHLGQNLDKVKSEMQTTGHGEESRAYTIEQIQLIKTELTQREQLAVDIARVAGLRAHEFNTLAQLKDQPASNHRAWRDDRFYGREGERYTVVGKGGLCREVMIPSDLASRLEETRRDRIERRTDRGIHYRSRYDLPAGKNLSEAFTRASMQTLGWSAGLHGCRHSYAQERVGELQQSGYSFLDAKKIVSQELGHFRSDVIETYLR